MYPATAAPPPTAALVARGLKTAEECDDEPELCKAAFTDPGMSALDCDVV